MNSKSKYEEIPIYNVRMMSDEEWNRLAYKNYLQRKQQETKNEKQTYQNTKNLRRKDNFLVHLPYLYMALIHLGAVFKNFVFGE